jgi:hypothetical protein
MGDSGQSEHSQPQLNKVNLIQGGQNVRRNSVGLR